MDTKPEIELIEKYLKKICEDRSFEKSPRNVRLLRFLVEKAHKKEDVNEYVVGLELFEQNYNPESNDSKVRVYMFNLRKKLEEYYKSSGIDDELKFTLTKGQYNLQFDGNTPAISSGKANKQKNGQIWIKRIAIATVVVAVLFVAYLHTTTSDNEKYCWKPFFEKNADNICIMADQIMIYHYINEEKIPRIIFGINSESDFIDYIKKHTTDSLQLADYTLFSKMAPYSVKTLTEWFLRHKSKFSLRLETHFQTDELRDNNILYIGQFKTMNTSKALFLKNSKKFSVAQRMGGFMVTKDGEQTKYVAHSENNVRTEYAMVSFMKLESGKNALFFVSNNDIGVMATVNNFTKKEWLEQFYKNLPANTEYFNALFEVSGLGRTEIDCKLIEYEVMP